MTPTDLHPWNVTPEQAVQIQTELAPRIERVDRLLDKVRLVAGVDVAYAQPPDERLFAAVVVLDADTREIVETSVWADRGEFPYQPGLFAFREIPPLLAAFDRIEHRPDLVICDGQGLVHPRRCGLASHFGLWLDIPTIGCGKTCLLGEYDEPNQPRGSRSPLVDQGEVVGSVLRTQTGVKPLFISTGHRVSLATAEEWILRMAANFRQPDPIRHANSAANAARAAALSANV